MSDRSNAPHDALLAGLHSRDVLTFLGRSTTAPAAKPPQGLPAPPQDPTLASVFSLFQSPPITDSDICSLLNYMTTNY